MPGESGGKAAPTGVRHACFPCKRKFPTAASQLRHERTSDSHRKQLEKREDRMRKRKRELIMACRNLRQQIMALEEEQQAEAVVSEVGQSQRMILEMQLQQVLGEYGQAQEYLESARDLREARQNGVDVPPRTREVRVGKLTLTAGVACWQSNKDVQEDRYMLGIEVESPEGLSVVGFAVLDGHSGSLCVDHVVDVFPTCLQRCLRSKPKLTDEYLTSAVQEACAMTDAEFLQKAREMEVLDGSTMILALVYPQVEPPANSTTRTPGCCKMLIACVGDSRAVMCQAATEADGDQGAPAALMAMPLSEDHKPSRPDEKARIESRGGIVDFEGVWRVFIPGSARFGGQMIARWGLAVSRAFGDLLLKEAERYDCVGVAPGGLVSAEPEIRIVDLEPSQHRFVVLASDGVWDVISSQDAMAICAAQASPELAAQTLLRRTYAANSDDNITALVLTWAVAQ